MPASLKALLDDRPLLRQVGAALLVQFLVALGGLLGVLLMLGEMVGALADLEIYYRYATQVLNGAVPYRDFRVEYPPLAVPLLVLPRLLTRDRVLYAVLFGCLMFLFNAGIVVLLTAAVRSARGVKAARGRLAWYTVCFCVLCPLAVARFDLVPAMLCTASVLAWLGGRGVSGAILAAVGVLVKIFPGAVAGVAFLGDLRGRRAPFRNAGVFAAVLAAGTVLWLALGGTRGVARSVGFQSERGLEVESLYAGALLLGATAGFVDAELTYDETAWHVRTHWTEPLAAATPFLQLAALACVFWRCYRSGARDLVNWSAAAVVALLVASKILSPQFMLWLLPLVALIEGRLGEWARKIFLPCCVATSLVFPWLFAALVRREVLPVMVLNLRNALLLGLLLLLLLYPASRPASAPRPDVTAAIE